MLVLFFNMQIYEEVQPVCKTRNISYLEDAEVKQPRSQGNNFYASYAILNAVRWYNRENTLVCVRARAVVQKR